MLFFDEKRLSLSAIISMTENDNQLLDGIVGILKQFALRTFINIRRKLIKETYHQKGS